MCKRPVVIVLAVLCGTLLPWAEPARARPGLMSRPELLVCIEGEEAFKSRSGALEAASLAHRKRLEAIGDEASELARLQKNNKTPTKAQSDQMAARIALHNRQVDASNIAARQLEEESAGINATIAEFNALCATRSFDPKEREAAMRDFLAAKADGPASAASGSAPAPAPLAAVEPGVSAADTGADAASADAARPARSRPRDLPSQDGSRGKTFPFDGGRYMLFAANPRECLVALQGTITRAASFMFDTAMEEAAHARCEGTITLLLESPGGGVEEGLVIGRQVRRAKLRTIARYECASSCAAIFLGGAERVLWGNRAAIGFHQIRAVPPGQKRDEGACVVSAQSKEAIQMRRYFHFVVSEHADDLFQVFMNTSCNSVEWLYGQAALDMGVATKLEAEGVDVFRAKESR